MSNIGAIVIHHRHFPIVLNTINRLVDEGIPQSQLMIVDNSENDEISRLLRQYTSELAHLYIVRNTGYGAAVNFGSAQLLAEFPDIEHILVATHETIPHPGAIARMQQALDSDPSLSVVGPSLVTNKTGHLVYWSQGGRFTCVTNEPRHVGSGQPFTAPIVDDAQRRPWIDGAFCLYRARVLAKVKFREDFFLYFEETELHARLIKAGHGIGWVPCAVVEQSSDGVPPYLLARNLQRFQMLHGTLFQKILTVPVLIARRIFKKAFRRDSHAEARELFRGWKDGIRAGR